MFSKEDYGKYFNQLARIQRKMIYGVHDLASEIKDPDVLKILGTIAENESRHYRQVLKLPEMAGLGGFEGRRESREDVLGTVLLRDAQNPDSMELKAWCVNLSKSGICLESFDDFSISVVWDLKIQLLDTKEAISHRARLVWSREIEPGCLMGGLDFLL